MPLLEGLVGALIGAFFGGFVTLMGIRWSESLRRKGEIRMHGMTYLTQSIDELESKALEYWRTDWTKIGGVAEGAAAARERRSDIEAAILRSDYNIREILMAYVSDDPTHPINAAARDLLREVTGGDFQRHEHPADVNRARDIATKCNELKVAMWTDLAK